MNTYERPLILVNEELTEGVYASSGSTTDAKVCGSIYLKGVYRALVTHSDADVNHQQIERGCEGCPVNWNNGKCNVDSANYDGDFRPSWEKAGYVPTDTWHY